jgi:hypothetical protein
MKCVPMNRWDGFENGFKLQPPMTFQGKIDHRAGSSPGKNSSASMAWQDETDAETSSHGL